MYGLVNKAVQDLVVTRFGQDRWSEIKRRADVSVESFVGMNAYPDEVTYKLVDTASEVLGLSCEEILEAFGEHWTLYTARQGYGDLLRAAGEDLFAFLANLDNLHTRIALSFPEMRPPSFHCTDVAEGSVRLHYYSDRPGLAPFVVGLVKGLGKLFGTAVDVALDRARADGHDHDEFLIRIRRP